VQLRERNLLGVYVQYMQPVLSVRQIGSDGILPTTPTEECLSVM
jgi:hypothetical protein